MAACGSALQLGTPARVPLAASTRAAHARMQIPKAAEGAEQTTDVVVPAATFVPPEVGEGFAGIPGAIELLQPDHPVLSKLLAKVPEEMRAPGA